MTCGRPLLAYLLLLPGLGLVLLFMGLVVAMAVSQSVGFFNFSGESGFTLRYWAAMLQDRQLWRAFFYSLKIATLSSILSVLAAYPLAIWLRRPTVISTIAGSLLKAPMMVPGLVAAFLYVNLIAFHGYVNLGLVAVGLVARPVRMQNDPYGIGVILLQFWKNMPFALLLLGGAVKSIGGDILDAARDLGAGTLSRFRRVTLPLTLRSAQAALAVIFIAAAGDFSFQVVAGPTSVNSLAQLMYRVQSDDASGWNPAAVVAVLLMAMSVVGAALIAFLASVAVRRVGR